ncbi:hypothetical protein CGERO_06605 [Corynebacterium gerontici]|uniref:MDMPI C-terminal domain-containing protein n=2 Tax=Corynebacterium gerontici TaxID=2079234 RepID=A0A3G6J0R0_9CORY|nr:hypothetical protein CGERO_06605 [Corynebacterium gerontici]
MAAHLYIREHEPLATAGMFFSRFSERLEETTERYLAQDYEQLLQSWEQGPGLVNPVRWLDPLINAAEHFVHHEDVRRAQGEPAREFSPGDAQALYRSLKMLAPRILGASEVPVVLEPQGFDRVIANDRRGVSERGNQVAHVRGSVGEILLWVFDRDVAQVEVHGPSDAIRKSSI